MFFRFKKQSFFAVMTALSVLLVLVYPGNLAKAESVLEDGSYYVDYTVYQAEGESVSIANDYFKKKAAVFVSRGKMHAEITVSHSDWIKSLQAGTEDSAKDVVVIEENREEDTRQVAFYINDQLEEPVYMQMHVQIPDLNYDHQYTVRLKFDSSSVEKADLTPSGFASDQASKSVGSSSLIWLYAGAAVLLVVSIGAAMMRRSRPKQ